MPLTLRSRLFYGSLLSVILALPSFSQSHFLPFPPQAAFIPNKAANYRLQAGEITLDSVVSPMSTKEVYEYNEKGQNIGGRDFLWDSLTSTWKERYKTEITYDKEGIATLKNTYRLENKQWLLVTVDTYDASTYLRTSTEYGQLYPDTVWGARYTYTSQYLPNGKIKEQSDFSKVGEGWRISRKKVYFYDSAGNNIQKIDSSLFKDVLVLTKKTDLSYDSQSRLLLEASFYYNLNNNMWTPGEKIEHLYYSNGRVVLEETKDSQNKLIGKKERRFDAWGNTVLICDSAWYGSSWGPRWRGQYAFNVDVLSVDLAFPSSFDLALFPNQLISAEILDFDATPYLRTYTLYYSGEVLTELPSSAPISTFSIYPNPSKGTFSIENPKEVSECSIYSLEGKLVKRFTLSARETHRETDFPKGLYLAQVNGQVRKLLIE